MKNKIKTEYDLLDKVFVATSRNERIVCDLCNGAREVTAEIEAFDGSMVREVIECQRCNNGHIYTGRTVYSPYGAECVITEICMIRVPGGDGSEWAKEGFKKDVYSLKGPTPESTAYLVGMSFYASELFDSMGELQERCNKENNKGNQ